MKHVRAVAAALVLVAATLAGGPSLAGAAGTAEGTTYRLNGVLTAKQMTKPRPKGAVARARGTIAGVATIAKSSTTTWTLTFSGLTGKVSAAEVRYPAAGNVSTIRLCAPCANRARLITTFPSKASAQAFVRQARAGKADVVLKTKRNPAGEIRGVVKAVPA